MRGGRRESLDEESVNLLTDDRARTGLRLRRLKWVRAAGWAHGKCSTNISSDDHVVAVMIVETDRLRVYIHECP